MTDKQQVIFEPLFPDVLVPRRATQGSAGYDVFAHIRGRTVQTISGLTAETVEVTSDRFLLGPGIRAAIPLGFRATLPHGVEAQLRLRSSVAFRKGLLMPNAPATVDPDYPGEWLLLVTNPLSVEVEIQHLERIAQIVFSRFETVDWTRGQVAISTDRAGGLGSTGR